MDKKFTTMINSDYYFFYKTQHPFSQWYKCSFEADSVIFNCAEQYMMYRKAVLFGDTDSAAQILKSKNPREQKDQGRKVKCFDVDVWNINVKDIVYSGNKAKFSQNEPLLNFLLQTENALIVEASPLDTIWGIGLAEDDPDRFDKNKWRGTNWLGEILTELRTYFLTHGFEVNNKK
jgi:ribA/ribD-fused uncharacterized protein